MSDERPQPASTPPQRAASAGWFSRLDRGAIQTMLLGLIAGVMVLAALNAASLIAVPTVLALLCAIALAPAVRWLERTGAPASLCAAFVVTGLLLGAATTVYSLAPSVEAMTKQAPQILRDAERRSRQILAELSPAPEDDPAPSPSAEPEDTSPTGVVDPSAPGTDEKDDEEAADDADDDAVDKLVEGGQYLLADWAIGAPSVAAGAAFWAMLTFFLLRDRVMLARWGMAMVSGSSARRAVGRAMRDVRTDVARYLLAITAINLALGICVAVAFQILGVANAPLWGVAAALLNFMPFIGIAILALVTLGLGIASFGDPIIAFAPFAVVIALNVVEAQIVTPTVIGARLRIAPIAVFVAIAFGAWLWGAAGALVATPALIVAVAFARRLNAAVPPLPSPRQKEGREERSQRGERGKRPG
jgi:predicted PurR-regulated permease PerM